MGFKSLDCRVLLGWMPQEEAVRFLLNECWSEPELSAEQAGHVWQTYYSRVRELAPVRNSGPRRIPLASDDWKAARRFQNRNGAQRSVVDFVRVDPLDLQVHQLHVVTEPRTDLIQQLQGNGWLQTAVLDARNEGPIQWRVDQNQIVFDLPNGEFILAGPTPREPRMQLQALPSFVSVAEFEGRLFLLNGYHRTFTWLKHCSNGNNSSLNGCAGANGYTNGNGGAPAGLLFPVSTTLPFPDPPDEQTRQLFLAPRPPLFRDFFDSNLALQVNLRKKRRFEMRVNVQMVGVDEMEEQEKL